MPRCLLLEAVPEGPSLPERLVPESSTAYPATLASVDAKREFHFAPCLEGRLRQILDSGGQFLIFRLRLSLIRLRLLLQA